MSWNANGMHSKLPDIRELIERKKLDLICINETKLQEKLRIKFKNYTTIRNDRPTLGGGVAIIIKNDIPHKIIHHKIATNIENICLKLADSTVLIAAYNPPRNLYKESELLQLTALGDRVLIIGDLNSRHTTWNNHIDNTNGRTLFSFVNNTNTIINFPDSKTHFPDNNMTPTCVDIIINKNVTNLEGPNVLHELSSDHLPIYFKIHTNGQIRDLVTKTATSFNATDWNFFRKTIDRLVTTKENYTCTEEIETEVGKITEAIKTAKAKHGKTIKITPGKVQISDNTRILIQIRNKLRKTYQRTPHPSLKADINDISKQIRTDIKQTINNEWEKTLEGIEPGENRALWRIAKSFRKPTSIIPTITENNIDYMTDLEKSNIIAETLEQTQTNNEKSPIENTVRNKISNLGAINGTEQNKKYEKTSFRELKTLIKCLPNHKAPGHDLIQNKIIKNLSNKAVYQLKNIFNACLSFGYFPTLWKEATVIPIPKPNKNLSKAINYRPISLLCCLSKLLERIVLTRIIKFSNTKKILINEQFGFRQGHSTAMQVARICDDVIVNFNKDNVTSLVLLDIEKAFDTVWIDGIIYKLIEYKFPDYILNFINNYLRNRKFKIKINNSYSQIKTSQSGVPQGSVLGPVIFSFFINDMPTFAKTKLAVYADDTAIYSHSFNAQVATKQCQIHCDKILDFAHRWKIKINLPKTEHIIFSRKFTNSKVFTQLQLGQTKIIPAAKQIKYLGVVLDKRLSLSPHISYLQQKGAQALRQIYPLMNKYSKLSIANKKRLYVAIMRPVITYAAPVWCCASKTAINKIQRTQNKCLRLVLTVDRYTPVANLHNTTNVERIDTFIKRLGRSFYSKSVKNSKLTRNITQSTRALRVRVKHKPIYGDVII